MDSKRSIERRSKCRIFIGAQRLCPFCKIALFLIDEQDLDEGRKRTSLNEFARRFISQQRGSINRRPKQTSFSSWKVLKHRRNTVGGHAKIRGFEHSLESVAQRGTEEHDFGRHRIADHFFPLKHRVQVTAHHCVAFAQQRNAFARWTS